MDHGYRFKLCSSKAARRLIWILAMPFAAVFLVQFFKLPYDHIVFTSLLSDSKVSFFGKKNYTNSARISNNHSSDLYSLSVPLKRNLTLGNSSYGTMGNSSYGTNLSLSHEMSEKIPAASISQMDELLQESRTSLKSNPPLPSSAVDKELLYAKSEIESAPLVHSNSELYEPVYRNISKFKRSYELMEKMLRVYIYKEGEKPIFHESILEGIYASEGWFLKLLESNKIYVAEDPKKAHLFYLPFSSRLLQLTLYVRSSHSRNNLIEFMKNYVEMLIQKYPFWNRTNGEDHFLAGCHDWAPAETRGRMLNCLRALCNADIKAGFVIGKDVSLPTVYVRSAKNPLSDVGGESPAKRPILAFFAGYMHGNVRPTLLKFWGKDTDMKILGRIPHVKGNKNYIEHMKTSKYCVCARGYAVHSPRVVESILYECVPVIISDNYVPPFVEVLNWKSFAVFILEKDIPDLKKILLSISEDKYLEMLNGVKEVQKHFLWHAEPVKYDLFHMILHSVWYNRVFRLKSA
ncbi:Acetylglucosaminyltransferase EXT1/exostosin 1 [Handroanthus impetiginosus]|uniref:Acetylglucosaminyltransferase EXT1/exostosin 1 n=1 Tax=Handroanthus impetiginosus TaxID=429701 RepID=A0A2G9GZ26_9LAMI|nr:Acetylglucosaminyltransferase EXT1/exostosin 1 [Handroanthus impetiginosus]